MARTKKRKNEEKIHFEITNPEALPYVRKVLTEKLVELYYRK